MFLGQQRHSSHQGAGQTRAKMFQYTQYSLTLKHHKHALFRLTASVATLTKPLSNPNPQIKMGHTAAVGEASPGALSFCASPVSASANGMVSMHDLNPETEEMALCVYSVKVLPITGGIPNSELLSAAGWELKESPQPIFCGPSVSCGVRCGKA